MKNKTFHTTSLSIRKWDLEHYRLYLDTWQVADGIEFDCPLSISIDKPAVMLKDFLNTIQTAVTDYFLEGEAETPEPKMQNQADVSRRLQGWFKKINSELNNPRRKKGQPKMIFTTFQEVYPEGESVDALPKDVQPFAMLAWARKYYDKGEYKKSIDPLRKLIKEFPSFGIAHKWLARSLKKIRKYDDAMRQYEKYVEVDNSTDAWLDLAKSYRKGKIFDKSEEIYHKILKGSPQEKEALIGLAQIYYAQKDERYLSILDDLHKLDAAWLKEWLVEEFNFRIYLSDKTPLSPIQAAKFLGYKRVFDLTEKAFKNDVPSHFNPARARVSFFREELENWANVMNRFSCLDKEVKLFPKKIDREDLMLEMPDSDTISRVTGQAAALEKEAPRTKLEDILAHIRESKARRMAMEQDENDKEEEAVADLIAEGSSFNSKPKTSKRKRPAKSTKVAS